MTPSEPTLLQAGLHHERPRLRPVKEVLVVDDVLEILGFFQGLSSRLAGVDVRLTTASNGKEALERLRDKRFDLVISDFRMQEIDGIEVLQAARRSNPDGLRVLITGYHDVSTTVERICAAQVDAYLQKPLPSVPLARLMEDILLGREAVLSAHRQRARELEALAREDEENLASAG